MYAKEVPHLKPAFLLTLLILAATLPPALAAQAEEKPATPEQDLNNFRAGYYNGCIKGQQALGKPQKYQEAFCACMLSVLREVPEADVKAFAQRTKADPAAAADPAFLEKLQQRGAADCALVGQFDDTQNLSMEERVWLREPKVFEGFSLRLPRGFITAPVQKQGPARIFGFGRLHADLETSTAIQVTLIDVDKAPPRLPTAQDRQQLLVMFLQRINQQKTDWTLSEPAEVEIGGLLFAAADWSAKSEGKAMQGTLYAAITDKKIVTLYAQDVQPYAGDTISLAKEVFRSFTLR